MSYPISGNVKTFRAKDYQVDHPLVVSVLVVLGAAIVVIRDWLISYFLVSIGLRSIYVYLAWHNGNSAIAYLYIF